MKYVVKEVSPAQYSIMNTVTNLPVSLTNSVFGSAITSTQIVYFSEQDVANDVAAVLNSVQPAKG